LYWDRTSVWAFLDCGTTLANFAARQPAEYKRQALAAFIKGPLKQSMTVARRTIIKVELKSGIRVAFFGCIRAERIELYRIARSHKLSDETARKLVREIELLEARFGTR
jgi:hypothetical protein